MPEAPVPALHALLVVADPTTMARVSARLATTGEVGAIRLARSLAQALEVVRTGPVDVVVTDAALPDGTGTALVRALPPAPDGPQVVVLADDPGLAVEAFEVGACDYLVRPVSDARLALALRRAAARHATAAPADDDETIGVDLAGTRTYLRRSQVTHATAHGDYVRLHTAAGTHLVRTSLTDLEHRWADAGFVRVHRGALVALPHVTGAHGDGGRLALDVGGTQVMVSRRHTAAVRALVGRPGHPWTLRP